MVRRVIVLRDALGWPDAFAVQADRPLVVGAALGHELDADIVPPRVLRDEVVPEDVVPSAATSARVTQRESRGRARSEVIP